MRRILLMLLCIACGLAVSACKIHHGLKGSGVRKIEKRELKSFNAIDTTGAYEVSITCQKPASFEIEADDNILPLIKTEVHDGVLLVTATERYSGKVALRISLPELKAVTSRGAGDITVADANGDNLKLESLGAAKVIAGGKVKTAVISSTGAGDIDAAKLQANTAKVSVTGAASVNLFESDQLDVDVTGVGSVNYSGNPKTVNKNVGGLGSVNKAE
jgi:hypothetical protein